MAELHFDVIGVESKETSPLYCIHTVPLDSTYFKKSLKGIDLPFQVVLIDLPGHGQSEDPDQDNLSFKFMADEIDSVRQKLNHERISILGHGVGGFIAFEYIINFDEQVDKIVLLNTAPNSKYRETLAWNIRDQYSKVTKQALEQHSGKTDEKSLRIRFTQSLATYFSPADHEMAKELMDNAHRIGTDTYVYISRFLLPNITYREQLRSVENPVLVLASTKDVWPDTASQLIRNDIIHAKYDEFETGHFPMLVQPEKFWNRVADFILD